MASLTPLDFQHRSHQFVRQQYPSTGREERDLASARSVCRVCKGPAKTLLPGTVKGGRRQGRRKKRREDSIREWTGLELGRSQKAVENRVKWKKLVLKSSVMPQRPSRLRDRWEMREGKGRTRLVHSSASSVNRVILTSFHFSGVNRNG